MADGADILIPPAETAAVAVIYAGKCPCGLEMGQFAG
jgi:hypothetical protein